jgi:hypothetical protein
MEGVSRQLAVAFAPVWTDIGNLGGAVGEKLVAVFSDQQLIGAARGVWSAIKDLALDAWNGVTAAARSALSSIFGDGGATWDSIRDVAVTSLIAVEYGLRNLGPLASQAWLEVQYAAAEASAWIVARLDDVLDFAADWTRIIARGVQIGINAIVDSINMLPAVVNTALSAMSEVIQDWVNNTVDVLNELNRLNPFWTNLQHVRIQPPQIDLEAFRVPHVDLTDLMTGFNDWIGEMHAGLGEMADSLQGWVEDAAAAMEAGRQRIAEDFRAFLERRLREIAAAPGTSQEHGGRSPGLERTAEARAVEAGSAEAFSQIYGRQASTQIDLSRRQLAVAERELGESREIRRALERAPVLRPAAL